MTIKYEVTIEIGTKCRILQFQRELVIVLMRIHGLNLILHHTRNSLHLLCRLIQQLGLELRMDNLADIGPIVVAIDRHDVIHQLKRVTEEVFSLIHDKLVITHTAIRLRNGDILEELITVFVFYDNLHGETAGSYTNSCHLHFHILVDSHILETVTVIFCINTIVLGLGVQGLSHQLFTGDIHITKIS